MNSDGYYDGQPSEYETFSRSENFSDPMEETEVLIGDDGVAKTVTKRVVTKTVTERRVRHVEEQGSLPRNNHNGSGPRHMSERSIPDNYDSMNRNHPGKLHSPHYGDETSNLLRSSASSSSASDDRGGKPSGYEYPSKQSFGSNDEVRKLAPEKFQPEEYGLEDDRRSTDDENDEYRGLEPNSYRERGSVSSGSSDQRYGNNIDDDMPVAAPRSVAKPTAGRAPLARQEAGSRGSLDRLGSNWHTPTLEEVIKMLTYNLPIVQQNAAAYIQHLCFNDDKLKADVRKLGGIPALVRLLDNPSSEVELNACGALRNLSYGSKNDKNKVEIKNCEGVPAVVRLIRAAKNIDTKEQATGTLWNLSALPELKGQVLELGLEPLTNLIIAPYADVVSQQDGKPKEVEMVDVFTNAVGTVRNLSSYDNIENRKRLRDCPNLVFSLFSVLRANIENGDIQNKATENCVCVLRNLTFQLQREVQQADTQLYMLDQPKDSNDAAETSCFGKKKDKPVEVVDQVPADDPDASGTSLLWQPEASRIYVALLAESQKRDELTEAALGALQNLTSGTWQWAVYARVVVRKEKALPVVIDRLRTDRDQIVRSGTTTLTNLAEDVKNKELIGKFAMKDLVYKLPGGSDPNVRLSDTTTIAVLNTIRKLVEKSPENTRNLRDAAGIERITTINNSRDSSRFHDKVVKAAGQLLKAIWANKEVRSLLKKDGWNKVHFTPTVPVNTLPRTSHQATSEPYERPTSSPNPPSTGGRRAQRSTSQSNEDIQMTTPGVTLTDTNRRKEPANSWV
nr:catenin delta-1 isoform X2 [Ciona intestinalis]|eukprot:XP_009860529.1 catenin delta-1 isoform X2 [Ciona intestinalis]